MPETWQWQSVVPFIMCINGTRFVYILNLTWPGGASWLILEHIRCISHITIYFILFLLWQPQLPVDHITASVVHGVLCRKKPILVYFNFFQTKIKVCQLLPPPDDLSVYMTPLKIILFYIFYLSLGFTVYFVPLYHFPQQKMSSFTVHSP